MPVLKKKKIHLCLRRIANSQFSFYVGTCRWGLSRHFHYVPEILAAFFWTVPALFNHVRVSFFFVQVEVWRECWTQFFFSIAVFALLLRDLSYYPSLWSSKTRWWSMQIQVSFQFNYSICWCYLLYNLVSQTPSLAWTTMIFSCNLMLGYIGMLCLALWNQHDGSPVELYTVS